MMFQVCDTLVAVLLSHGHDCPLSHFQKKLQMESTWERAGIVVAVDQHKDELNAPQPQALVIPPKAYVEIQRVGPSSFEAHRLHE